MLLFRLLSFRQLLRLSIPSASFFSLSRCLSVRQLRCTYGQGFRRRRLCPSSSRMPKNAISSPNSSECSSEFKYAVQSASFFSLFLCERKASLDCRMVLTFCHSEKIRYTYTYTSIRGPAVEDLDWMCLRYPRRVTRSVGCRTKEVS